MIASSPPTIVSARRQQNAFTMVELLVVIGIIAILAGILLPAFSKAKSQGEGISCVNNSRQLTLAWLLYIDEQNDHLPYNLGGDAGRNSFAPRNSLNWVNGIMNWETDSDNTNYNLILDSSLSSYGNRNPKLYKCPADKVLSDIQQKAGFRERTRSYSMNAMLGDAGDLSMTGTNVNNPSYKQFFRLSEIRSPASIFVFLEEHPDSINDGYFLVKPDYNNPEWVDLPASYHNKRSDFSFADGHVELHKWTDPETIAPAQPDGANLPRDISLTSRNDFYWLLRRTSVPQ